MKKKEIPLFENFKALGTVWGVLFFEEIEENKRKKIENTVKEKIITFEEKFSRFKEDSLVSLLNTRGDIPYDRELEEMLLRGDEFSRTTEGVFSLFIKKELEEKGYGRKTKGIDIKNETEKDWETQKEKIYLYNNSGLDLGGIGKGFLIDLLANYLKEICKIESFLISGGGDLYAEGGGNEGIEVFLENPAEEGALLGSIFLKNESLCSSSSFKRKWVTGGELKNHFITQGDEVWAASFVLSKTATAADVFATTLCILTSQPKKLERIMKQNKHIEFLVVGEDGSLYKTKRFEGIL